MASLAQILLYGHGKGLSIEQNRCERECGARSGMDVMSQEEKQGHFIAHPIISRESRRYLIKEFKLCLSPSKWPS